MVDYLLDDAQLLVQPQHAYHCLEIMVKAQVAASSGATQSIDSTFHGVPYRVDDICVQTWREGRT